MVRAGGLRIYNTRVNDERMDSEQGEAGCRECHFERMEQELISFPSIYWFSCTF